MQLLAAHVMLNHNLLRHQWCRKVPAIIIHALIMNAVRDYYNSYS